MITFKKYLAEIDMIDGKEYSNHDSDNRASEHDHKLKKKNWAEFGYKKFESNFSSSEFELFEHMERGEFTLILVHKKTRDAAVTLMMEQVSIDLDGEKFTFWSTDVLSALKKYQGLGLSPIIYRELINSGRFIVGSSHEQTEGGAKTWTKVLRIIDQPIYVVAEHKPRQFVLLKGKLEALKKAAYDSYNNRFMIIPDELGKHVVSKAIDVEAKWDRIES